MYESATNSFVTQLGPVHTNIVLLDEINRSSAKTQSAMLEAMEERQTTIAGTVYPIPEPFLVIATQNPVDQEGTYPLSEAQTDRFMLKDIVSYPTAQQEVEVMFRMDAGLYDKSHPAGRWWGWTMCDGCRRSSQRADGPRADAVRQPTRRGDPQPPAVPAAQFARVVEYGASPRATIAFCNAARALAVLPGRDYVIPDDIAKVAHRVLRHRLILGFEAARANLTPEVHRRCPAKGSGALEAAMGKHLNRAKPHFGTDARGMLEGGRYALLHSRSLEFDDLRPYVPGDDVRDIDWKASARSGSC